MVRSVTSILIICVFLSGCGDKAKRVKEIRTVFRYNEAVGITSLDPAFAKGQADIWACNQLFNGLVQMNDELEVIPCIAKSWKISDDGITYTFYLRDEVFFHTDESFENQKTRKVIANDFVFSFNRILDP